MLNGACYNGIVRRKQRATSSAKESKMRKSFFKESSAKKFAKTLETQGVEDIEIWGGRDAFGQEEWTVVWYL